MGPMAACRTGAMLSRIISSGFCGFISHSRNRYSNSSRLVLAVISAVALLGGNLMAVFGFQYRSVGQLILYFLLVELISIPLDPFCQGTPRALYKMGRVNRRQANMLYIPLDALCTFFAFWLADRLMDGVSATGVSLWVIAFVLALLTLPVHRKEDSPPDG